MRIVLMFFTLWFLYGCFIKVSELEAYNLQQMGVDAIVEHKTFEVGLSSHVRLQPIGDVFEYGGRRFAAKQPGQFAFGALAYVPLRALGVTYESDFVKTSAWVTWLSSTSFAALAVVLVFVLLNHLWGFSTLSSLSTALTFGLGTSFFVYSGVAHHDIISTALLLSAFAAFECFRLRKSRLLLALSGFCAGLTLFVSMLPALVVLVGLVGAGVSLNRSNKMRFSIGVALGLAPLAIYNWHYFGSPFTQANAAGNYSDTFFKPTWSIFSGHFNRYFLNGDLSIWKYAPASGLGLLMLPAFFAKPEYRNVMTVVILSLLAHFIYVLNIETYGTCLFGPRYFLPCFALMSLPLALFFTNRGTHKLLAVSKIVLVAVLSGASLFINLTGSLMGSIHCHVDRYLPALYWTEGMAVEQVFPLRTPMLVGLATCLILLATLFLKPKRTGNLIARN